MCLDRYHVIAPLRSGFASFVSPLQYAVAISLGSVSWLKSALISKADLLKEKEHLYEDRLRDRVALQQLAFLQHENKVLKSLLGVSEQSQHTMKIAKVLAFEHTRTRHVLTINQGYHAGIFQGQLVLDADGMIGQVIEVAAMTSTVLLISDAASAVPVRNQRTGEAAILAGTNIPERLSLIYLPKTASVQPGDVLMTSDLGQRYPAGYPVGVVNKVEHPPGEAFIRIDVQPFTKYYHTQFVLLVWPQDGLRSDVDKQQGIDR